MGSLNDWLTELVRFLELQLPPDGTGLVYLFIWTSVVEPLKFRLIQCFPIIPVGMVGLGYVGVLGLLAGNQHFEEFYATHPPLLNLLLVFSLWLAVSGFFSIIMTATKIRKTVSGLPGSKVLGWAWLAFTASFALALGLVYWLFGEGSIPWSVLVVLFMAGMMMLFAGFLAVVLGTVAVVLLDSGRALANGFRDRLRRG